MEALRELYMNCILPDRKLRGMSLVLFSFVCFFLFVSSFWSAPHTDAQALLLCRYHHLCAAFERQDVKSCLLCIESRAIKTKADKSAAERRRHVEKRRLMLWHVEDIIKKR